MRPMKPLRETIAGILMCDADDLPIDTTPLRDYEGWDSLKHVMLVLGLESAFSVTLSAEDIQSMVTIADIQRVLNAKGLDG